MSVESTTLANTTLMLLDVLHGNVTNEERQINDAINLKMDDNPADTKNLNNNFVLNLHIGNNQKSGLYPLFTQKNVYFLVFVAIAIISFVIATLIRHHQQKLSQRKKEQEFLRYYHSVLPHSRIYGNLNELFAADGKVSSKLRRKNSKRKPPERGHRIKEQLSAAMYKNYPYNPYVSEMEEEALRDDLSESGVDIIIENTDEDDNKSTKSNPELVIQMTKKKVMWRKYSFSSALHSKI